VKLIDLSLVIFNPPDLIGKYPGQPINGLSLPRRHLRWMNLVLRCNLLRGLVTT
jgi:hypothetical protein